jgi:hypothetical protein
LCSFTFADEGPPLSRLKPRPSTPARKPTAITLRALCAPVSVPFVVNPFPRSQALAGEAAGKDIPYHLSGSYVSACDLSSALGRLSPLSPVVVAGLSDPPARWPRAPCVIPRAARDLFFAVASRPNPRPSPAPSPARIHQRLRRQFLARNYPQLA